MVEQFLKLQKQTVALFIAVILVNQVPPAFCRQRLEPLSKILHGAGQDGDAFFSYSAYMGSLGPSFYMTYCGLGGFNSTSPGQIPIYFQNLAVSLSKAAGTDNAFIFPQIGLQLPLNGAEADVGRGLYDNAIIVLRDSLVWLNRPVLLRIGYEFNGPWNNYTAAGYRGAYNRIASMLRASPALNETVAFIWDGSCDTTVDPTPFWPGAAYVDWIGVNIFTGGSAPVAPQDSCVWDFLTDAKQNGYPVILGEVTPRGYFTTNASTWDAWFVPFLSLLAAWEDSPIKAVSYIDKDWEAEARWKGTHLCFVVK